MVIPCGVQAVGAMGSAGATALGLGLGKTDLELSRSLFMQQMRQTKRLWTADWAESSIRHGESCMQAAQQHSEAQALATASYYQAEKLASQGLKLARDQDSRAYEMSWRTEVRESLRDELGNQNNRFNIVMLCDTVCLGCVFTLVCDGTLPSDAHRIMVNVYILCLGVSIMFFSISLWGSVIVVRRLHDNTAAKLERKLFALSEDLQKAWRHQVTNNIPTGPQEIYLIHQAYEKWLAEHINPIGKICIEMLSFGVVTMFIGAGLLIHSKYLLEYQNVAPVPIFWSTIVITCITVLCMKYSEDRKEKKKQGVYDISWQDDQSGEDCKGPFAKISKALEQLSSSAAVTLGSAARIEAFGRKEQQERDYCAKTRSLHNRVTLLRKEARGRAKIRKEVVQLLTTAAEELDALPEELTSLTNKMLLSIDEADVKNAELVGMNSEFYRNLEHSPSLSKLSFPMSPRKLHPIDAQRIPVSLTAVRRKLGEISHTTLIRIRNTSDEPLRLKSGVQLNEGKYIMSLNAADPHGNAVSYHFYPITEIPSKTEALIAARSRGAWVPTSGIHGEVVYTNRSETWCFKIRFRNALISNVRRCRVEAFPITDTTEESKLQQTNHWEISKDEFDASKANNEIVVSIDCFRGEEATTAMAQQRLSCVTIKRGFLRKQTPMGLWKKYWFVLTPKDFIYSEFEKSNDKHTIPLKDIINVQQDVSIVKRAVFQVFTRDPNHEPIFLSAPSTEEQRDWIVKILEAVQLTTDTSTTTPINISLADSLGSSTTSSSSSKSSRKSDSVECVYKNDDVDILPV